MNPSPDIQIAYRCSVCHTEHTENAFNVQRRRREFDACVCRECSTGARAFAIGVVVDSVTGCRTVPDPYARTVDGSVIGETDGCTLEMYRPPTHRVSARWSMLIIGLITIAAGFAVANWWVG